MTLSRNGPVRSDSLALQLEIGSLVVELRGGRLKESSVYVFGNYAGQTRRSTCFDTTTFKIPTFLPLEPRLQASSFIDSARTYDRPPDCSLHWCGYLTWSYSKGALFVVAFLATEQHRARISIPEAYVVLLRVSCRLTGHARRIGVSNFQ
ncbi:hypothetical protein CPC08DRAFT_771754 [Agrocybe pediades]|nr:hypothetical protein CPC08DRAFT_771754 [Agrocybe pediades]